MTSCCYRISGRVQGVGFRYFVLREAQALGLVGWTRNLADGRVEVVAAGSEAALGALEGRLRQGPPHARVSEVVVTEAPVPEATDFRIIHSGW